MRGSGSRLRPEGVNSPVKIKSCQLAAEWHYVLKQPARWPIRAGAPRTAGQQNDYLASPRAEHGLRSAAMLNVAVRWLARLLKILLQISDARL